MRIIKDHFLFEFSLLRNGQLSLIFPARRAMDSSRWLRSFGRYHRILAASDFAPGWALENQPEHQLLYFKNLETLFQRPSGRNGTGSFSGGCASKATLTTGYYPPPIRAKTNLSKTKLISGTCLGSWRAGESWTEEYTCSR